MHPDSDAPAPPAPRQATGSKTDGANLTRYFPVDADLTDPHATRIAPTDVDLAGTRCRADDPAATRLAAEPTKVYPPFEPRRFGNYELLEVLARGGMGVVYKARQISPPRLVALKMILAGRLAAPGALERFRMETRASARLDHPGIVPIFEADEIDGQPFFSMGLVTGGSLQDRLAEGPLPPRVAARIVQQVAEAVHYAHQQGIIHRDLKPHNVLLQPLATEGTGSADKELTPSHPSLPGAEAFPYRPKVSDFGLARMSEEASGLTATGEILGTPQYMPPEQASGNFRNLGPSSDVYSLGGVLYCLLTGRPPFQSASPHQTMRQVIEEEPVSPRQLNPGLPRDLETICLKCLEKSPKKRYSSAEALADDLRRYQLGQPIVARPTNWAEMAVKWARREPWQAAACGFAVAGVLVLVGGFLWVSTKNQEVRDTNTQLASKNAELEETNHLLAKSKAESEALLNASLETMDQYHFVLGAKLADVPRAEKLRVEVLNQAKNSLLHLYDLNPRRQAVWDYLLMGFNKLGQAQMQVGDLAAAAESFQKAADSAARLMADHPENVTNRVNRAGALSNASSMLERTGHKAEAQRMRAAGEQTADELIREHPRHVAVLTLNQTVNRRRTLEAYDSGKVDVIEATLRTQRDLNQRLTELEPDKPYHRLVAATDLLHLIDFLSRQGKATEADELYAQAEKWTTELSDQGATEVRILSGKLHESHGSLLQGRRKFAEADAAFRKGLVISQSLASDFPDAPSILIKEADSWSWIGLNSKEAGRFAEAQAALMKARDLAAGLMKRFPHDDLIRQKMDFITKALGPIAVPGKSSFPKRWPVIP
ncbi:MAG TPA: serine/threonine-protein kinase [Gemmataceae bacterium]|nr:serine/threonine-protein kinase [Gemmataceae bacterium]